MRRRNVKNAKQRVESHPELVILNPKDYKGKWNTLFKNDKPIYLEIGIPVATSSHCHCPLGLTSKNTHSSL